MRTDMRHVSWISLGAGGHAASVADALRGVAELAGVSGETTRTWDVQVFADDDEAIAAAARAGDCGVIVTVGSNPARLRIADAVPDELLATAAAPSATVAHDATLGAGTVVMHQAHVGPAAKIGRAVIVNTGAIVEHDVVVGDGAHLAPGSAVLGEAHVGARAFIGSGARVLPGRTVGADAVVGAGAVVTEDVPSGVTVVGQPARAVSGKGEDVQ
jgi:sugar O-acyltransferase (sialic acid O-acetyltransferase NeuD family)